MSSIPIAKCYNCELMRIPCRRTAGPIRNRRGAAAAAAPAKRSKKPATAEDLDKELDAFMKDDDEKPAAKSDEAKVEAAPEKQGDVEMT